jgi:UDP-hydrolysing UDP-N-acetyl-D-glucosamine 2-epimerase
MERRISCVIVDRANYGRLSELLRQIQQHFELSIICCGSTVLDRFHKPVLSIASHFKVTHKIYHEVEGSNEQSVVNSMSMLMPQLMLAFKETKPDFVLIIGDRFETLAVATVAAMMKLCIVHIQGGEHSGNVDESIRHAITKLSHYHIPATNEAASFVCDMGEQLDTVLAVGCPSADIAKQTQIDDRYQHHLLCVYHPEDGINNGHIVKQLLNQLQKTRRPVIMLWPNIDADSDRIHKVIRRYLKEPRPWLEMVVNFDPEKYLTLLASVKCCVGNSSSFVRDASFFGTPVVLIGNRQKGRIKTCNIRWYQSYDLSTLHITIKTHEQNHFKPSNYYGRFGICSSIVDALRKAEPYSLKMEHTK